GRGLQNLYSSVRFRPAPLRARLPHAAGTARNENGCTASLPPLVLPPSACSELEEHGTASLKGELGRALHRGPALIGRSPRRYDALRITRRSGSHAQPPAHLDIQRCRDTP